ncbi:AIPR family protein [Sinorhizobium meliloti]|uniref:AIPR family protein n=1 Tax=Rhizobium meliloti TaxID=382 RepID=UPI0012AA5992|nr:AIPR family protein [Sinorhizobium meliloti]QGJ72875.1 abortive phage resistance protein [Sinorhizobium meliloti]
MSDELKIDLDQFRTSWLEDVREGNPSTVELGRRFALKLVTQWLDTSDTTSDFIYCDGSGDGGIDVALLDTGPDEITDDSATSGHTWYLVQSKYGSAFAGTGTLLIEGQKVIDTIDGRRPKLNSLAEGLLERLSNFRNGAGTGDKIVLVYATERSLSDDEKRVLNDLRAMGTARLGAIFDVETISIETIHARLREVESITSANRLMVDLKAQLVPSGPDLLVGSVGLLNLYDFLKSYRERTGDLDRIYEKNVRRFLGGRGKVNKAMQGTLRDAPERFGLYNNGITIVVHGYEQNEDAVKLAEPYIVNGCQTTRTIWEVFHNKLSAGGTGVNPETDAWRSRAAQGVVVAKIAKVGDSGESLLQAITRYTNSQNAIKEKDFLALTGDFKTWQGELATRYNLYLEIQRGGWDSQKALQNTTPMTKQFTRHANAADLVKVYGAGWLGEVGLAFGKNPPFLPDGSVFKRIVNESDADGGPFGAVDLYAAYLLQQATIFMGFGRGAEKQSRRQTRFLFAMIVIDLFRDVLSRAGKPHDLRSVSASLVSVLENDAAKTVLLDQAAEVIDGYFTQGSDDSVFIEPAYLNSFNSDLNAFLKWEKLGKSDTDTPRLKNAMAINKAVLGRSIGGINGRDTITAAMNEL